MIRLLIALNMSYLIFWKDKNAVTFSFISKIKWLSKDIVIFCQVSFFLEKQGVITTYIHIYYYHTAYTSKFSCEFHDYPLMFDMDTRIDQCTMWNVLRYMYIRDDFEISIENMDSFVLLAYFVSILLFFLLNLNNL